MKWITSIAASAALLVGAAAHAAAADDLAEPFALRSAGAPIAVEVGHAAPHLCDWDGDGKLDLLVGQMGQGRLRIYRNTGSAARPAFDGFEVFQAGEAEGTVPSG